jgi:F-type H+-transporting ATPase subunit epsilon
MMDKSMQVQVFTPDKQVLKTETQSMNVLLPDGWWGILPGHAPMISYLESGVVHYKKEEQTRYIAIYQGTIEVISNLDEQTRVLILTSAAEEGPDLEKVKILLDQQASKLEELAKEADIEFKQMRIALEKSLQKINVS